MNLKPISTGNKMIRNEEYKIILKKRRIKYLILFMLGLFTTLISLFSEALFGATLNGHTQSYYTGMGFGIMFGVSVVMIKLHLTMSNETSLKKKRLQEMDERNIAISNLALRMTAAVFIVSIYVIGIILGIFNPQYANIIVGLLGSFFLLYSLFYRYYKKKM